MCTLSQLYREACLNVTSVYDVGSGATKHYVQVAKEKVRQYRQHKYDHRSLPHHYCKYSGTARLCVTLFDVCQSTAWVDWWPYSSTARLCVTLFDVCQSTAWVGWW